MKFKYRTRATPNRAGSGQKGQKVAQADPFHTKRRTSRRIRISGCPPKREAGVGLLPLWPSLVTCVAYWFEVLPVSFSFRCAATPLLHLGAVCPEISN